MTVDAYIPRWRLTIEADGRRWHTRKADFERDRRRDNAAAAHGLVVLDSPTRCSFRSLRSVSRPCSPLVSPVLRERLGRHPCPTGLVAQPQCTTDRGDGQHIQLPHKL